MAVALHAVRANCQETTVPGEAVTLKKVVPAAQMGQARRPAAPSGPAMVEPEDRALPEPPTPARTRGTGGELTERCPATVRLVVCRLAVGRATGFLVPAVELDLPLMQGGAVSVQLALGHPRGSEARGRRCAQGRLRGLAAGSLHMATLCAQGVRPMGAICLQDPECPRGLRLVGPSAAASPERTHSPHRPTWGPPRRASHAAMWQKLPAAVPAPPAHGGSRDSSCSMVTQPCPAERETSHVSTRQ